MCVAGTTWGCDGVASVSSRGISVVRNTGVTGVALRIAEETIGVGLFVVCRRRRSTAQSEEDAGAVGDVRLAAASSLG